MPTKSEPEPIKSMSDEEILDVFKAMNLPTEPPLKLVVQQAAPIVFYRVTGDSPPLPG